MEGASAAYRSPESLLLAFLAERCITDDTYKVAERQLTKAWRAWCEAQHEPPGREQDFVTRMEEAGFESLDEGHPKYWLGVGLVVDE